MAAFTNQATLLYNGTAIRSNTVTGELLEVLGITKTAVPGVYAPGETITYLITLKNTGAVPLTGLTVTDDLGAYGTAPDVRYPLDYVADSLRYFTDGALQTAPTVTAGPPLTITGLTVPAGGDATIIYAARANDFAPPAAGSTIVNTAAVTGTGLAAQSAQAEVTLDPAPRLTIAKSLCPAVITENGQLTYTFTLQNTGAAEAGAEAAIQITDLFDPILRDITVTLNGDAWPQAGNYTYDAATGLFSTAAGQITVPAATFVQDETTGVWTAVPGVTSLAVSGRI